MRTDMGDVAPGPVASGHVLFTPPPHRILTDNCVSQMKHILSLCVFAAVLRVCLWAMPERQSPQPRVQTLNTTLDAVYVSGPRIMAFCWL